MIGIASPKMTTRIQSGSNLKSVIKTIKQAVKPEQVKEFSQSLEDIKNPVERAEAIYHFIINNIQYRKDAPGTEEIRTPARTWADRNTGVDCEDYTIFSAAVGANLGMNVEAEIVDFGNGWAHIYPVLNIEGLSIPFDPTPYPDGSQVPFGERPPMIVKTMKVKLLEGIGEHYAGVNPIRQIQHKQHLLRNLRAQGNKSPELAKEYRKCQYLKTLSGNEFTFGKLAMTYLVDDVPADLSEFIPKPGVTQDDITGFYHLISGDLPDHEVEYILSGLDEDSLELFGYSDLSGIGKPKKKKEGGGKVKKFFQKAGEKVKKVAKKAGEVVKKAVKFVKKTNPIMVSMRAAIRLALKINLFKITAKFKIAQIPRSEAIAKGVDPNEYDKLRKRYEEFLKTYEKLGGKPSEAEKTIAEAKVKRGPKVEGLGVAPAAAPLAAGATAAVPLFKKILDWLKGIDFKKLLDKAKSIKEMIPGAEDQPSEVSDQEIENAFKVNSDAISKENDAIDKEMMSDDKDSNGKDSDGKSKSTNTMLYIGAAGVLAAIFLLK